MKVTWEMNIGEVHKTLPDDEVLAFVQSLIKLGFTPEVTHE